MAFARRNWAMSEELLSTLRRAAEVCGEGIAFPSPAAGPFLLSDIGDERSRSIAAFSRLNLFTSIDNR